MRFIDVMADIAGKSGLSRAIHYVIMMTVGLPLIYFLSVGPAVVIVVKVPSLRNPVRAIYTPIIWLHDRKFLYRQMDFYLGFWEKTARQI